MNQPTTGDVARLLDDHTAAGSWTLDPGGSSAEFRVKHFWGVTTIRGTFDRISGAGTVGTNGTVTGRVIFEVRSLNTKNQQRDKHLRSADFFDVDHHPDAILTVTSARPMASGELECEGTFEAAGHVKPVAFTVHVQDAGARATLLTATLELDRSEFGMTWSPLRTASMKARGFVKARFVRE